MRKGIIIGTVILAAAFLFAACTNDEEDECVEIAGTYAVTKTFDSLVCAVVVDSSSDVLPLASTLAIDQINCSIAGSETVTLPGPTTLTIPYLGGTDEDDRFSMSVETPGSVALPSLNMMIGGNPYTCSFAAGGIAWQGTAVNSTMLAGTVQFDLAIAAGQPAACPATCAVVYNFTALK